MSKYTTEVRFICETMAGLQESEGYDKVEEILDESVDKIFDFDYPIFDESYRTYLQKKILKHYYTQEIGLETVGLWKLKLNTKMNEIMPYYNQLYKSELIEFNPLYDVDITREYNRTNRGETESSNNNSWSNVNTNTGSSQDTNWSMFNDTPQGGLQDIDAGEYLTNATKNTSQSSDRNTNAGNGSSTNLYGGKSNGLEDYIERVKGTNGGISFNKRIKEFRQNMLNIDMQVIDSLKDLFMYLW